jgi:hypothetical protein
MSEFATYLKMGTTALVLVMIEDGFFNLQVSVQRSAPSPASPRFGTPSGSGRAFTAIGVQCTYLEA